jgi:acyl carrier protein
VNTDLTRNIVELLSQVIGDIGEIQPKDNLFKLGILDSVLLIQLVERIEDTFSISIEDRELSPDYFLSIERIHMFLQHKLDNANDVSMDSDLGEEKSTV